MLGVGLEPTPVIHGGDFKSPVSTIPPSKQEEEILRRNRKKKQARCGCGLEIILL